MATAFHAGVATDPGLKRTNNEDRVWVDEERGILLVVDGLGGHAAGETAAETAVQIIRDRIAPELDNIEDQIHRAIADANNEIFRLAQSNEEYRGMACVLTLAVAHKEHFTLGHVGDSRLYLVWNGSLRKLTSDHSYVGEQEDLGALTEEEAMRHPRRNEVFRDVGSILHEPGDPQFIETRTFLFRPDAALLVCSDGLSDALTSAQINAIIERFDGDPDATARQLVEAANAAGGNDNVSVIFLPGPEFLGSASQTLRQARSRHSVTRIREERPSWRSYAIRTLFLVGGIALGILLSIAVELALLQTTKPAPKAVNAPVRPSHITVNPADPFGLINALSIAHPGDTVDVPPGQYFGPVHIKDQVNVAGNRGVVIRPDPAALTDAGIAMVARGVSNARLEGLRILGDATHPMKIGLLISGSAIEADDLDIAGATEAGIRIERNSAGVLLANFIHGNPGSGVSIVDRSAPRLAGNHIPDGRMEIAPTAKPSLENNTVLQTGPNGTRR